MTQLASACTFLVVAAGLLVGVVAAEAQVCPAEDATGLRRVLPVNVVDAKGEQVRGLTAANFRGKFRGQPVKVLSANWDTGPRRVVILLDVSEDMMSVPGKFELALAVAEDLVHHLGSKTDIALLTFTDNIIDRIEFGAGEAGLAEKLNSLRAASSKAKPRAQAASWDTVLAASAMLEPAGWGDSIYPIAGTADTGSRTSSDEVERTLLNSGTRLYGLLLWDEPSMALGFIDAVKVAEESGGMVLNEFATGIVRPRFDAASRQSREGPLGLRQMFRQMAEFYRVEVELPVGVAPSAWLRAGKPQGWTLDAVDERGKKMKDVQVLYPRKLVPCGVSAPSTPLGTSQRPATGDQ